MASLTDDILFEILLLLPAKSMARFRCVCKSWRNLLINSDFLDIYNNTHKRILISSYCVPLRIQSMIYNFPVVIENIKIPTQFSFRSNWLLTTFHFFSSCNGLVLSVLNGYLFLWNPTTRDCMKLPAIQHYSSPFYGIGYVSGIDDFKVVRGDKIGVKIYSRISNSWKIIREFPENVENIWKRMGTGFNGFLHWIVFTRNMEGRLSKGIVSLDLETEEYKVLPLPDDMTGNNNYILIHLGVLEGFLCVVYNYYGEGPKVWTIWVMEEYGVKESWFKLLEIPKISNLVIPLCVTGGEIIMQVDCDKIVKYDPISEEFKTLVDSSQFSIKSIVYGESFTAPMDAKRFMQGNKKKLIYPSLINILISPHKLSD